VKVASVSALWNEKQVLQLFARCAALHAVSSCTMHSPPLKRLSFDPNKSLIQT